MTARQKRPRPEVSPRCRILYSAHVILREHSRPREIAAEARELGALCSGVDRLPERLSPKERNRLHSLLLAARPLFERMVVRGMVDAKPTIESFDNVVRLAAMKLEPPSPHRERDVNAIFAKHMLMFDPGLTAKQLTAAAIFGQLQPIPELEDWKVDGWLHSVHEQWRLTHRRERQRASNGQK